MLALYRYKIFQDKYLWGPLGHALKLIHHFFRLSFLEHYTIFVVLDRYHQILISLDKKADLSLFHYKLMKGEIVLE